MLHHPADHQIDSHLAMDRVFGKLLSVEQVALLFLSLRRDIKSEIVSIAVHQRQSLEDWIELSWNLWHFLLSSHDCLFRLRIVIGVSKRILDVLSGLRIFHFLLNLFNFFLFFSLGRKTSSRSPPSLLLNSLYLVLNPFDTLHYFAFKYSHCF